MTANEAAKACMERVAGPLDDWFTPEALAVIEREFTEVIGRVTPTPLSVAAVRARIDADSAEVGRAAMKHATESARLAQARCPECDHDLGNWATPHREGCGWAAAYVQSMTAGRAGRMGAPCRVSEQALRDAATARKNIALQQVAMTQRYAAQHGSPGDDLPEPAPPTLWGRVKGWFR